ncbi:unnamed protein product [Rotaria sp. Silwood2]|nr:unnamed protein product [Rotaria sp. Silwood2]CAF3138327.1 unnamed protein product [Rotaria sp. Silwood2]CAF3350951.1 unnamed protein product [Rotaria sp. Silwood2]CAF4247137.1 unnamed protein product [Rotaria sp. Silwood2]CAF4458262.1 unnamed protein product [Rotaria sp. Silwood2]
MTSSAQRKSIRMAIWSLTCLILSACLLHTIAGTLYLIELHIIHDPCLRVVYDNTKQLINQIDQAFSHCIQTIK